MLNKLLLQKISIPQLTGYILSALAGMSIIFSVFYFYVDVKPLFSVNTGLFKHEFFTINKKVSLLSSISSGNSTFTNKEIENIKQQSFVKSVSYFKPCLYSVKAYTTPSGSMPAFSTEMFFESVPDKLLDNSWPDYKTDSTYNYIPIIIPRDYLNLYNFGFAGSRGLPQISENIVTEITFSVEIYGQGKSGEFKGRIVGFSDYLNTILVPDEFMNWANQNYGASSDEKYSRLIVEVENPADPEIAEFFAEKNYIVSQNKGEQGKLSYFLKILIIAVLAVGCFIMLPALWLMFLSVSLLVYKNQKMFENLIMLGYKRSQLAKPYCLLVLLVNIAVAALSLVISILVRSTYSEKLVVLGLKPSPGFNSATILALVFFAIVAILNILWIRNKINKIQPPVKG